MLEHSQHVLDLSQMSTKQWTDPNMVSVTLANQEGQASPLTAKACVCVGGRERSLHSTIDAAQEVCACSSIGIRCVRLPIL